MPFLIMQVKIMQLFLNVAMLLRSVGSIFQFNTIWYFDNRQDLAVININKRNKMM